MKSKNNFYKINKNDFGKIFGNLSFYSPTLFFRTDTDNHRLTLKIIGKKQSWSINIWTINKYITINQGIILS